jgi:hypothetical protein
MKKKTAKLKRTNRLSKDPAKALALIRANRAAAMQRYRAKKKAAAIAAG